MLGTLGSSDLVGSDFADDDNNYQPPVLMRQPAPDDQVTKDIQQAVLDTYRKGGINHGQATRLANLASTKTPSLQHALLVWNLSGSCKSTFDDSFRKHDDRLDPMGGALFVEDELPRLVNCCA